MRDERETCRLDKWLWQARLFKTRARAAAAVRHSGVRVNGVRVSKPSRAIGVDDVLTLVQSDKVRALRVRALGARRGPFCEARDLYDDLSSDDARG